MHDQGGGSRDQVVAPVPQSTPTSALAGDTGVARAAPLTAVSMSSTSSCHPVEAAGRSGSLSETSFPMKLYKILCHPEYCHTIDWMPHGRSWKVLDREVFLSVIFPQYFAQTRYESFVRQVNGWGFTRM